MTRFAGYLLLALLAANAPAATVPDAARQKELLRLLRDDCGSCHGRKLTGGLGPALTAKALAGKPDELLQATIIHGRPGTPMPPWQPFLSESETAWLIHVLRSEQWRKEP